MPQACDWDSRAQFELLIEPLRAKARELGYAIAVHGTLKRDIDLVAIPWTEEAAPAYELAMAVKAVAKAVCGQASMGWAMGKPPEFSMAGCPGWKPHGRLAWTFVLGGGPYIDLAVMPRQDAGKPR